MNNLCTFSALCNITFPYDHSNNTFTDGFNLKLNGNLLLYGLIESYGNVKISSLFKEKLVSKICTNFANNMTDIEIKNLLYQAFLSIENLIISDSECDNGELNTSGLAVIVIVIINDKLYLANTGSNVGLLCRMDDEQIHHIDKLNIDHSFNNPEEVGRISSLGIDVNKLKILASEICPLNSLRIIGDRQLKSSYKNHPLLCKLTSCPWSASPYVTGPLIIDESSQIFILFPFSLYEALSHIEDLHKYLCTHILESLEKHNQINEAMVTLTNELNEQIKLNVAGNKMFTKSTGLLFHCFNEDLLGKNVPENTPTFPPLHSTNRPKALKIEIPPLNDLTQNIMKWDPFCNQLETDTDSMIFTKSETCTTTESSTLSTEGSSNCQNHRPPIKLDENGQIAPYVDFSDFDKFITDKFNGRIDDLNVEQYFFVFT